MSNLLRSLLSYAKKCPVTTYLIVLNLGMFILTVATSGFTILNLSRLGALVPEYVVTHGDYYRILTSMFLHGSALHFLTNMLAMYFLGTAMERSMGPARYLALYLLAGIGGGVAIVLFGDPLELTIGASGALYGIMAGMLFITFRRPHWFTPASVRSIRQTTILNFVLTFLYPNISIIGHVAGFVFGFLLSTLLIPKTPYFLRSRSNVSPIVDKPDDTPDGEDGPTA